jgi:hypothetical protein
MVPGASRRSSLSAGPGRRRPGEDQAVIEAFLEPANERRGVLFRPTLGNPPAERVEENESGARDALRIQEFVKAPFVGATGADFRVRGVHWQTGPPQHLGANYYGMPCPVGFNGKPPTRTKASSPQF